MSRVSPRGAHTFEPGFELSPAKYFRRGPNRVSRMRKAAGLKRGSRKKQQNEDPNAPKESSSLNSGSTTERRKLTGDEAALTSKNYRLAKELVSRISLFYH